MGPGDFHLVSVWIENFLYRHQYMIVTATAISAVAIVVLSIKILLLVRQQAIAYQRANQIAGIGLFIGTRDRLNDHLGYLCYCTLLGGRPSIDSLGPPQNGLSLLLDALHDNDASSLKRVSDHPKANQFRSKATMVRSPEMQELVIEIDNFITLADDCGCSTMIDGRITVIYSESKKGIPSIRGPGIQP